MATATMKQHQQNPNTAAYQWQAKISGNIKAYLKLLSGSQDRLKELSIHDRYLAAQEFATELARDLEVNLQKTYSAELRAQQDGKTGLVGRLLAELELLSNILQGKTDKAKLLEQRILRQAQSDFLKAERAVSRLSEQLLTFQAHASDTTAITENILQAQAAMAESLLKQLQQRATITSMYAPPETEADFNTRAARWAQQTARLIGEKLDLLAGLAQQCQDSDSDLYFQWRDLYGQAQIQAFDYLGKLQSDHLNEMETAERANALGYAAKDQIVLSKLEEIGLEYVRIRAAESVISTLIERILNLEGSQKNLLRATNAALNVPGGLKKLLEVFEEKSEFLAARGIKVLLLGNPPTGFGIKYEPISL